MKLLLIAYEFPPVISGQAVRWYKLANAMAEAGAKIDVLAPRFLNMYGFTGEFHPGIKVHRTFVGPFVGLANRLAGGASLSAADERTPAQTRSALARSGSAVRAYRGVRRLLNNVLFPDVRTEWYPFARKALTRLVKAGGYHAIIGSHEPGVDILLGLAAKTMTGRPLILDIGDPMVTPLAPGWRRNLDARFEKRACDRADHILVTCPQMRDFLIRDRAVPGDKITVVTQGFDRARPDPELLAYRLGREFVESMSRRFTLVYTGNFYKDFRNPVELAVALEGLAGLGIQLVAAGQNQAFRPLFASLEDNAVFMDMLDHPTSLALQAAADVVVNIGNRQPLQVPGKVFEYLGSGRPILHIGYGGEDFAGDLVGGLNRGLVVANRSEDIRTAVSDLYEKWKAGTLNQAFDLSMESVRGYTWSGLGAKVLDVVRGLESGRPG